MSITYCKIANALELLQSCTKPSTRFTQYTIPVLPINYGNWRYISIAEDITLILTPHQCLTSFHNIRTASSCSNLSCFSCSYRCLCLQAEKWGPINDNKWKDAIYWRAGFILGNSVKENWNSNFCKRSLRIYGQKSSEHIDIAQSSFWPLLLYLSNSELRYWMCCSERRLRNSEQTRLAAGSLWRTKNPRQRAWSFVAAMVRSRSVREEGRWKINSLAPGRSECDSKDIISNLVLLIGIFRSSLMNATGSYWW